MLKVVKSSYESFRELSDIRKRALQVVLFEPWKTAAFRVNAPLSRSKRQFDAPRR